MVVVSHDDQGNVRMVSLECLAVLDLMMNLMNAMGRYVRITSPPNATIGTIADQRNFVRCVLSWKNGAIGLNVV